MSIGDIAVTLCVVVFAIVWFMLMRASVRSGG
jgi:hypothetical protein